MHKDSLSLQTFVICMTVEKTDILSEKFEHGLSSPDFVSTFYSSLKGPKTRLIKPKLKICDVHKSSILLHTSNFLFKDFEKRFSNKILWYTQSVFIKFCGILQSFLVYPKCFRKCVLY